jgi:hypothetical protein
MRTQRRLLLWVKRLIARQADPMTASPSNAPRLVVNIVDLHIFTSHKPIKMITKIP